MATLGKDFIDWLRRNFTPEDFKRQYLSEPIIRRKMTNEELIRAYPYDKVGYIKVQQVTHIVNKVFDECKCYREIRGMVIDFCLGFWPEPKHAKWDDPIYQEWSHYFWGDYEKNQHDFDNWLKKMQDEFLLRNGARHTLVEACQLAADEWTRMIFGVHIQDNGDKSESGFFGMMLATIVKDKAAKKATPEIIEKFRSLCRDYYLSGCIYEPTNHRCEPYCDYHPNSPLADLLIKAGMKADDIGFLCPVKTGILIDDRDYTVVVRGYQTERYI